MELYSIEVACAQAYRYGDPFWDLFRITKITRKKGCSQPLEIGYMDRPAGWLLAMQKISGRLNFWQSYDDSSTDASVQRRSLNGTFLVRKVSKLNISALVGMTVDARNFL